MKNRSYNYAGWVRLAIMVSACMLLFNVAARAQTQLEMNEKACREYQQADAELNRVYQKVLTEYKPETAFIEKFKKAQRAWVAFRDAEYDAVYPADDKRAEYGSMHEFCRCNLLAELTRKRTAELKQWVDGIPEGDACAGSIKSR